MKTGPELLAELGAQTYASVPFPLSHQEIEEAVDSFFEYLTLPQEVKEKMCTKRATDPVSDMGYVRTNGEKAEIGKKDHKEYFHYHPDAQIAFADATTEPKVRAFFDKAQQVFAAADAVMHEVIRACESEYPGIYDAFFPASRPAERLLRFLKYDSRGMGKFLARAHYDRGGCTLALAESAPGLRIGKDDASLAPVVHEHMTAIFMPSFHFSDLTHGAIPPAWHDVVQASEDLYSNDTARWAVVMFANAPELAFPSTIETHVLKN